MVREAFDEIDAVSVNVLDEPRRTILEPFNDIEPLQEEDTPELARQRAGEAFDIAKSNNIPLENAMYMTAGPEPSAFGKMVNKVKDYIAEKTGIFAPDISDPDRPSYREENMMKTIGGAGAYFASEFASGLTLNSADIITDKMTGDKTLAELVNRLTGFEPTGREEAAGKAGKYAGVFLPVGYGVKAGVKAIPAAQALKTILASGLSFSSTEAVMEFSENIITGKPMDWDKIHYSGGIGVLWGTGEVVVAATMSGLTKAMDKYWGEKGIELADKIRPNGTSIADQYARQKLEIRADVARAKQVYRETGRMPEDLMDKYVRGNPQKGSVLFKQEQIAPVKPKANAGAVKVRPGFDAINSMMVEEAVNTTKLMAENTATVVKNIPKVITYNVGRGANFIENTYGSIPAGKQLAKDAREIAYQTANRFSKQREDLMAIIKDLTHAERIKLGQMGQGREQYKENAKLQNINNQLLELMDKDMIEADAVGYRRLVSGKWHNIKGSGEWYPQVLNETGKLRMTQAQREGLGNSHVMAAAEDMVTKGKAATPKEALGKMLDWNNNSIRGTHGYFESTRTILPEEWVEMDIAKILPHTLSKNAKMIAAAKVWGVEQEAGIEKKFDFTKAKELLGQIGENYGVTEQLALKKWIRTEFGLSNDIPKFIEDTINIVNSYETQTKLGFRVSSAIRNLTQGNVNLFTAPLSAHFKGTGIVLLRKWIPEAEKIYNEARRSGAVSGLKEVAEIEKGSGAEPVTPGLAMKMFAAAEESNQIRAAILARLSAETHINNLAKLKAGGILNKILMRIKYVSVNPEGYLERFIKNKIFTNPISEKELQDIWSGRKSLMLDDIDRIMHRMSVDTQFIQDFASRPIPWKTNPFLRLGLKFKTFAINQTRLIYQDAIKEALKGNLSPLLKYLLFSSMAGELWNLTRDFIFGGDNALITQLMTREEKRNIKDISIALANDFIDGAGVGILADMTFGIGNWVIGVGGQTGKNILEWASNLRHPVMATEKLIKKEIAVAKDLEGLLSRADRLFFNENNRFFEYKRTKNRVYEWIDKQKEPSLVESVGKKLKQTLIGRPKYQAILPYEFAAKQITLGDVQDAADYLTDAMNNDKRSIKDIEKSIRSSMRNYSPLGRISQKDVPVFLKQFSPEERERIQKLQKEWITDYENAIKIAKKQREKNSK